MLATHPSLQCSMPSSVQNMSESSRTFQCSFLSSPPVWNVISPNLNVLVSNRRHVQFPWNPFDDVMLHSNFRIDFELSSFFFSVVGDASVPTVLHAVLCPEHERVITDVPVRHHVLPTRLERHLTKVVRLGVKKAACAVSLETNFISMMLCYIRKCKFILKLLLPQFNCCRRIRPYSALRCPLSRT